MSEIRSLAKKLAGYGRNGDTEIVHMQPAELMMLEHMTGKKASTNPVTGAKEGFAFLIPLLASLLGSIGGAVANKVLAPKETKPSTDESAAGQYIKDRGKEALAKYDIPVVRIGGPQGAAQKGYTPGVDPERQLVPIRSGQFQGQGFAEGGQIPEQDQAAEIMHEALEALQGNSETPEEAINRFVQVFGQDALKDLMAQANQQQQQPQQGMAQGGLLQGPGNGMDDLMRARVAGGPEVALSGGEHIVPADAVSMLGDGSTEAGSRKLTAMEQRVRMQKTGTPRQAGKINDRRVMPA